MIFPTTLPNVSTPEQEGLQPRGKRLQRHLSNSVVDFITYRRASSYQVWNLHCSMSWHYCCWFLRCLLHCGGSGEWRHYTKRFIHSNFCIVHFDRNSLKICQILKWLGDQGHQTLVFRLDRLHFKQFALVPSPSPLLTSLMYQAPGSWGFFQDPAGFGLFLENFTDLLSTTVFFCILSKTYLRIKCFCLRMHM